MPTPLLATQALGQHLWLDNLSRTLLREGLLQRLVAEDGIDGVTSNPAIFHKAVTDSPYYRDDLARLKETNLSNEQRYEALAIPDIQAACDALAPVHARTAGEVGYVSLEVSPHLAHDEEATVAAAQRLHAAVDRANLLIKVPATPAGLLAVERLLALGINVNVTLMFSEAHYEAVAAAYLRGARKFLAKGGQPAALRSVASVFMSRIDTLVDKRLEAIGTPEALALRGQTAVAVGRRCYRRYRAIFHSPEFADLAAAGVRPQTPLWASTGTKNPAYSDLLYVEPLIGPETINTLPDATLAALRDHGQVRRTVDTGLDAADAQVAALTRLGIDLDQVGETLQVEGTRLFVEAYDKLLALTA